MLPPSPGSWRRWWPALWLIAAAVVLLGRFGNSLEVESFGNSLWGWLLRAPSHTDLSFRILLPFAFGLMLWNQRPRAQQLPAAVQWRWFPLFLAGLAAQVLAYRLQVPRLGYPALLAMLWAGVALLRGWRVAREYLLPVIYLLLALPDLFHGWALWMRIVSAETIARLLAALDYPWVLHGTLFLRVAEPLARVGVDDVCSGISSLSALIGIMVPYAVLVLDRQAARWLLLLLCVPAALFINILRIGSVLLLVEFRGEVAAMAYHDSFAAGAVPYALGVLVLAFCANLLHRCLPAVKASPDRIRTSPEVKLGRPISLMAAAVTGTVVLLGCFPPAHREPLHPVVLPDQVGPWARVPHGWCVNPGCGAILAGRAEAGRCPECQGPLENWSRREKSRLDFHDFYATAFYRKEREAAIYVHALVAKSGHEFKAWPPRILLEMDGDPRGGVWLPLPGPRGERLNARLVPVRLPEPWGSQQGDPWLKTYVAYWFAAEGWTEARAWRRDLRVWAGGLSAGALPRPITYLVVTPREAGDADGQADRDRLAHFVTEFNRALELQRLDAVDRGR